MKRLRGDLEASQTQLEKAQAESVRMRDEERRKLQQDITELTAQNSSLKFDNERMLGEVGGPGTLSDRTQPHSNITTAAL